MHFFRKIGEIRYSPSDNGDRFAWDIDDLCCDDEGNLYVADGAHNKVHKFDSGNKYIKSFGCPGQGPGEFMVEPTSFPLQISYGNDDKLHIFDPINLRISSFSKQGIFLEYAHLKHRIFDRPHADSKGNIYILSHRPDTVIDKLHATTFEVEKSFFDVGRHFVFPFIRPSLVSKDANIFLRKVITKSDHLICLSNYSLAVFHFNEDHDLIESFNIRTNPFLGDFLPNLRQAAKKGDFIAPFNLFLDGEENICLSYFNREEQNIEIYRYRPGGKHLDLLRFPGREAIVPVMCTNKMQSFYAVQGKSNTIAVFNID